MSEKLLKDILNHSELSIRELLALRHADDLFVPKCKMGATMMDRGDSGILDAWAMKPSWASPLMIGYEIKVSRSDFLRDDKYRRYFHACNEFYFVAPKDVIRVDELPDGAGLLTVTAKRLLKRKRAPYREIVFPENLIRYILHSRLQIRTSGGRTREQRIENWLIKVRDCEAIDFYIKGWIKSQMDKLKQENSHLKYENESLSDIKSRLEEMGIDTTRPLNRYGALHDLEADRLALPLKNAGVAIAKALEFVKSVESSKVYI